MSEIPYELAPVKPTRISVRLTALSIATDFDTAEGSELYPACSTYLPPIGYSTLNMCRQIDGQLRLRIQVSLM